jgi:predicted nucleic acid-binding protein
MSGSSSVAIVDAGPLFAAADLDDPNHERAITILQQPGLRLVIPALEVAGACYP